MDINFHYFAVKTVAIAAGYDDKDAQRIAEYSQLVDDYNGYGFNKAKNIPEYLCDSKYDIVVDKNECTIRPVATGFPALFDIISLILKESKQRFVVSPFHFIPKNNENLKKEDFKTFPAKLNDDSFISKMLKSLKGNPHDKDVLMKMGMLMHTFADTYAHQGFSGYDEELNLIEPVKVINNINNADVTKDYKTICDIVLFITKKIKFGRIGHTTVGHLPDLSHLTFEVKAVEVKKGKDCTEKNAVIDYEHNSGSRNNTTMYIEVCHQLYDYMREFLGNDVKANMEWNVLEKKLKDGFYIDISKTKKAGTIIDKIFSITGNEEFGNIIGDLLKLKESQDRNKNDKTKEAQEAEYAAISDITERIVALADNSFREVVENTIIEATENLEKHWSEIFGYKYHYRRKEILESFVLPDDTKDVEIKTEPTGKDIECDDYGKPRNFSDDFYKFNMFAEDLLIELYGEKPRK